MKVPESGRLAWRNHDDVLAGICGAPIIPTVLPEKVEFLDTYVQLLSEQRYPALEVLCRPPEAALPLLAQVFQGPLRQAIRWGIGTICSERTARQATALQPDFLVSPAFSRPVLKVAVEAGIPYIPAVRSFQDVQDVLEAFDMHGLSVRLLKLCPVYGLSLDYLASLCSCFPGILFCPTGEVTLQNYLDWKSRPGIAVPMGSRFVPRSWIERAEHERIRRRLSLLHDLAYAVEEERKE